MMIPANFQEANKNLLKPENMTDGECGSLPVFCDGNQCVSLWKLSWRERISIVLFNNVWLQVISGYTQPPVVLSATKTIFEKRRK